MPLFQIKPDKWKHAIVGFIIAAFGQWVCLQLFSVSEWGAAGLSLLAVAIIAYGFELFSRFTGRGHYELWDAIASVIGGVAGVGLMLAII